MRISSTGGFAYNDASWESRLVLNREAKERPFPCSGDGTLSRVDLELETSSSLSFPWQSTQILGPAHPMQLSEGPYLRYQPLC
jgi:hypothetical protein